MAVNENNVPALASQVEAPAGAADYEVEPSPRGSVRDTIAAIEAELARHEPAAPVVSLSDVKGTR